MPLVVGALLALAALAWVMMPLFTRSGAWLAQHDASPAPLEEQALAEAECRELALDVRSGRLDRSELERLMGRSSPDATPPRDR